MRVLFLDFDGVLHPVTDDPSDDQYFMWLPHLVDALAEYADVSVVVHSTWRYLFDDRELRALLGALGNRFVGAAPRGPRYEAITWWLHLNEKFDSYRILDDAPGEFPEPAPEQLIVCHSQRGVSDPVVLAQLRSWLGPER